MWILFLLLHVAATVSANVMIRHQLKGKLINPWQLATIMQVGMAIPVPFLLLISPPDWGIYGWSEIAQMTVIALLIIALHSTNVGALKYLEVGVYAVLYNLRIIIATFLGIIFLGEEVVPLRIAGGLLIFMAVLVVRQDGDRRLIARGMMLGVAAAFVISTLNMFEKDLIDRIDFVAYSPAMILASLLMIIGSFVKGNQINFALFTKPRLMFLMTIRAASAYSFLLAFATGALLSVGQYISSLSVIVLVIIGAIFLGETDHLGRKAAAGGLALLGLTVILIANHMS